MRRVGSLLKEILSLKKSKEIGPCFNYKTVFLNVCALDLSSRGILHLDRLSQKHVEKTKNYNKSQPLWAMPD